MPYQRFDRSRLVIRPLDERQHDMTLADVAGLDLGSQYENEDLEVIARRIMAAKEKGAAIIVMMGAHVIKTGMSRFIITLIEKGFITHVAMNGAGAIHDFELSMIGATTESVARYISEGQFGLWRETGLINEIAKSAVDSGLGLGEALGRFIAESDYPHKDVSILAAGYKAGVPVTVHVAIGQDIIHEHPNCDGAALGEVSYRDFLIYTNSVDKLEGGVMLNLGTAVMGPEVYLKALSMVRNVAYQEDRPVNHFTTAVFDLYPFSGEDYHTEAPKTNFRYYYRPWKTILVRTVQDGGESFYIEGHHRDTISTLYRLLTGRS